MKHRSVVISAVFVMLMVVGPQAAQQFSALREAAGNQLQAGIWNVFLSYHAQKIERPEQPQHALAAACDAEMADASASPARRTKRNDAVAVAVETKSEARAARRPSTSHEEDGAALDFVVAANLKEIEGLDRVGREVLKKVVLPIPAPAPVALSEARRDMAWAFADERESARHHLRTVERDRETTRRLAEATERALRTKTADREWKLHQHELLKVYHLDALKEYDPQLKAPKMKVRPRIVLRASKPVAPAAPGTRLAPTPPASVVAC